MTSQHWIAPRPCVVLLVDDDPDILSLCLQLLTWSGHCVDTAADGAAALRSLSSGRFEAAILDVDMPGMSGLEVARGIRASPDLRHCAIVLHTASARRHIDAQFTAYEEFVAKPCFGNELANALTRAVGTRSAIRSARA